MAHSGLIQNLVLPPEGANRVGYPQRLALVGCPTSLRGTLETIWQVQLTVNEAVSNSFWHYFSSQLSNHIAAQRIGFFPKSRWGSRWTTVVLSKECGIDPASTFLATRNTSHNLCLHRAKVRARKIRSTKPPRNGCLS